jgi:hypothetical protein
MPVFRFAVRAQPTVNNPKYATWQPADLVAFIVADNGPSAEKKFQAKLTRLHWKILEWKRRDRLIDERVRKVGGQVLQAYEVALKRGEWYRVDSEHFMADTMASNPMSPPRPDESFIDKMVFRAGGRRLTLDERGNDEAENADYLIDELVVEAKDLQEERLGKEASHEKIAEVFWPYFEEAAVIPLDPSILSDVDYQRYINILARPIDSAVKKASRQVRATTARTGIAGGDGGIILLNSGYTSLPHKLFEQIAAKAIEGRPFKLLICLTAKTQTNGFDSYMTWEFSPKNSSGEIEKKLFNAFDHVVSETMTEWGRGGFMPSPKPQPLAEPVSFEYGGKIFSWDPGKAPFSSSEIAGTIGAESR